MTVFNAFIAAEDNGELPPSLRSPSCKERTTFSMGPSSSGKEHILRLCATNTVTKSKNLVKKVRKIIKRKRPPRDGYADIQHRFRDELDACMLAAVEQSVVEVYI